MNIEVWQNIQEKQWKCFNWYCQKGREAWRIATHLIKHMPFKKKPGVSGVVVECEKVSLNFLNSCTAGCSLSGATVVNFRPLRFAIPANLAYFWIFVASGKTLGEQAVVVDMYLCNHTLHRWRDLATSGKNDLTKAWMQSFIQKAENNWQLAMLDVLGI